MYLGENCAQGHFVRVLSMILRMSVLLNLRASPFKECTEEEEGVGTTPGLERSLNEL